MSLRKIDFSRVLKDDQVYDHMMASYDKLGRDWIVHQWSWMNNIYAPFKDHYKYFNFNFFRLEKTLQFYDQMNISYYLQIQSISIDDR